MKDGATCRYRAKGKGETWPVAISEKFSGQFEFLHGFGLFPFLISPDTVTVRYLLEYAPIYEEENVKNSALSLSISGITHASPQKRTHTSMCFAQQGSR